MHTFAMTEICLIIMTMRKNNTIKKNIKISKKLTQMDQRVWKKPSLTQPK